MQTENLLPAGEFCERQNIEFAFLYSLHEAGLVSIETVAETAFIQTNQLPELEKFIRLHYDLEINVQGIEAVSHLLQRVQAMQDEITSLKNKLRMYESY
jgi:hypothetical protein